jgi:hypothetical protein
MEDDPDNLSSDADALGGLAADAGAAASQDTAGAPDISDDDAHAASSATLGQIPEKFRRTMATVVSPEIDFDRTQAHLDDDPTAHFGLAGLGDAIGEQYISPQRRQAINRAAEVYNVDPQDAQRFTDQMAGARAMNDVRDVLRNQPVDPARARMLQQIGLLQQTPEADGTMRWRVTNDALPLLVPTLQHAARVRPDVLAAPAVPGPPGETLDRFVQAGRQRLARTGNAIPGLNAPLPATIPGLDAALPATIPGLDAPVPATIPGLSLPGTGAIPGLDNSPAPAKPAFRIAPRNLRDATPGEVYPGLTLHAPPPGIRALPPAQAGQIADASETPASSTPNGNAGKSPLDLFRENQDLLAPRIKDYEGARFIDPKAVADEARSALARAAQSYNPAKDGAFPAFADGVIRNQLTARIGLTPAQQWSEGLKDIGNGFGEIGSNIWNEIKGTFRLPEPDGRPKNLRQLQEEMNEAGNSIDPTTAKGWAHAFVQGGLAVGPEAFGSLRGTGEANAMRGAGRAPGELGVGAGESNALRRGGSALGDLGAAGEGRGVRGTSPGIEPAPASHRSRLDSLPPEWTTPTEPITPEANLSRPRGNGLPRPFGDGSPASSTSAAGSSEFPRGAKTPEAPAGQFANAGAASNSRGSSASGGSRGAGEPGGGGSSGGGTGGPREPGGPKGPDEPGEPPTGGSAGDKGDDGIPVPRVNIADAFKSTFQNGERTYWFGDPQHHGLTVKIDRNGVMSFDIRHGEGYPESGTDMISSLFQRLDKDGVKVNAVAGDWRELDNSLNYQQYMKNVRGMSKEAAAADTWTGRLMKKYGFTRVEFPEGGSRGGDIDVVFKPESAQ